MAEMRVPAFHDVATTLMHELDRRELELAFGETAQALAACWYAERVDIDLDALCFTSNARVRGVIRRMYWIQLHATAETWWELGIARDVDAPAEQTDGGYRCTVWRVPGPGIGPLAETDNMVAIQFIEDSELGRRLPGLVDRDLIDFAIGWIDEFLADERA